MRGVILWVVSHSCKIHDKLCAECRVLAAICVADCLSTFWLLCAGAAAEANPILLFYIQEWGYAGFLAAKLFLSLGPLAGLEMIRYCRPKKNRFVKRVMMAGIIAYLLVYALGTLHINHPKPVPLWGRAHAFHRTISK